jgi:tetratricopeptide (TPR) repeat protein
MKKLGLLFLLIPWLVFSQEKQTRLALVIGNANYDQGALKNPVNDARLIAQTLDSLNFEVLLKENLSTQLEFKKAILEFGKKRPSYDVAFVYYAGHGVQIDGENYLLPTKQNYSSSDEVELLAVSVQDILGYLESQTDKVNILILDACRDNPFESNWNTTRSLKGGGLAKIPPPTGSLIAFSTDSGQTAPDGDGENSIYTQSLAKNMLLEDTSVDQVFRNVRSEVLAATSGGQRPVEATQLTGETFFLNPSKFEDQLKLAQELLDNKNYLEALSVVEPILKKDSLNIAARERKIDAYQGLEKYDQALKEVNRLINQHGLSPDFLILRAKVFENLKNPEKAELDFNKAIALDSTSIYGYEARGDFYFTQRKHNESISDFTKILELNTENLYALYGRGTNYHALGVNDKAIVDFSKCVQLDKDKSFAKEHYFYNDMALVYRALNQNENALEYLTKVIEINPEVPLAYINRARLYSENLEEPEKAESDFNKAIEIDSTYNHGYRSRGDFYYNQGKYNEAILDYSKILELEPENLDALHKRGNAYWKLDVNDKALVDFSRCEQLDKDKAFAKVQYLYNGMALAYRNLNQYEKALEYYTKEIEISPDAPLGYVNRARLYAEQLNDPEKAELDFNNAIALDSTYIYGYESRGNFHYNQEKYDEAILDNTKILKLDPENLHALEYRGRSYWWSGKHEMALEDFSRCEQLDKENSYAKISNFYNAFAVIYRGLNQYEKALEYYTKEIEIRGQDPLAYTNRARLYAEQLNDPKNAESDFNKAIALDSTYIYGYEQRGYFYYLQGKYNESISDYSKILELEPENLVVLNKRAWNYWSLDNLGKALVDYSRCEQLDKDKSFAIENFLFNNMAGVYRGLNQYEKALEYYTKEIEIRGQSPLAYKNRAHLYVEVLNDPEKAELDFNKAIALDSTYIYGYQSRGTFFHDSKKDFPSAINDFSKIIELQPNEGNWYTIRGDAYFSNKNYDFALNDYFKAIELDANLVHEKYLYGSIADAYKLLGDYEKALEFYTKEIENNEDSNSLSSRAEFYGYFLKDHDKAELDFQKALELAPKENNLLQSYANYKYYIKDFQSVIALADQAIAIEAKDPQGHYLKSRAFKELNKPLAELMQLSLCIDKIEKYSHEGYYIEDFDGLNMDFGTIFLLRAEIFKQNGEMDSYCDDLNSGLNYTKSADIVDQLTSLIQENCQD